jgi:hypothetical protein
VSPVVSPVGHKSNPIWFEVFARRWDASRRRANTWAATMTALTAIPIPAAPSNQINGGQDRSLADEPSPLSRFWQMVPGAQVLSRLMVIGGWNGGMSPRPSSMVRNKPDSCLRSAGLRLAMLLS